MNLVEIPVLCEEMYEPIFEKGREEPVGWVFDPGAAAPPAETWEAGPLVIDDYEMLDELCMSHGFIPETNEAWRAAGRIGTFRGVDVVWGHVRGRRAREFAEFVAEVTTLSVKTVLDDIVAWGSILEEGAR